MNIVHFSTSLLPCLAVIKAGTYDLAQYENKIQVRVQLKAIRFFNARVIQLRVVFLASVVVQMLFQVVDNYVIGL